MTTYDEPWGQILIEPPARKGTVAEELLDWAAARPLLSLGAALGLGFLAALLLVEDRKARKQGVLFRASRLAAAGLIGQASSFLLQFLRALLFG